MKITVAIDSFKGSLNLGRNTHCYDFLSEDDTSIPAACLATGTDV